MRPRLLMPVLLLALASACGPREPASTQASAPAVRLSDTPAAAPAATEPESAPLPGQTYDVLGAGTVTTSPDNPAELLDAVPADGWTLGVPEQDGDELKVPFTRGDERVTFKVDDDDEVEIEACRRAALRSGLVTADGGTVAVTHDDDLALVDATASPGWTVVVEDADDDVEVEFTDGTRRVDVEIEEEDDGLEVEVCEDLRRRP